jgi:hypothetical protein
MLLARLRLILVASTPVAGLLVAAPALAAPATEVVPAPSPGPAAADEGPAELAPTSSGAGESVDPVPDPRAPDAPEVTPPVEPAPAPAAAEPAMDSSPEASTPPAPRVEKPARRGRAPVDPYERALRKQRRAGLGMTIGGFALFGTTYLASAYAGVSAIDEGRGVDGDGSRDDREVAYGQRLLIPVVGPFVAAAAAPSATEGLATVLAGVAQTASLAVGIAGSVIYVRAKRKSMERLAVTVTPRIGGASLGISGRF